MNPVASAPEQAITIERIIEALGTIPEAALVVVTHHTGGTTLRTLPFVSGVSPAADDVRAIAHDAAAVTLALFTTNSWHSTTAAAAREFLLELTQALGATGTTIAATLLSTTDAWGPTDSEHPSPHHPAGGPPASKADLDRFSAALRRAGGRTLARDVLGHSPATIARRARLEDLDSMAALGASLAAPSSWAPTLEALLWETPPELAGIAFDETVPAPDARRLETAATLLEQLAALTRDRHARIGTLALRGWVLAACGKGTAAVVSLDEAIMLDPTRIAVSDLRDWLAEGHLPAWVQ